MTLFRLIRVIVIFIFVAAAIVGVFHPDKSKQSIEANNKGFDLYKAGDLDGAIANYNQAIELNPNDPIGYNNRGLAKEKKGGCGWGDGRLRQGPFA